MLSVFQQMESGKSVSSITHSGTTATVTSTAHGYSTGDVVVIKGAAEPEYDGAFTITVVTANTFTYTMASTPASNASGSSLTSSRVAAQWGTFTAFDSHDRAVLVAQPSAVSLPPDLGTLEQYADLLHNQSGNYYYLSDSAGQVATTDYYSDAATVAPAYFQGSSIQRGETGTPVPQELVTYTSHTGGGATVYPVASDAVYSDTAGAVGRTTDYSYTWYSGGTQMQTQTVTLPGVDVTHNGPGTTSRDDSTVYFDAFGRPEWTRDADGHVGYVAYDPGTGAAVETVTDVDYSALTSGEQALFPSGWTHPGGGLHLVTTEQVDGLGRTTEETSPGGNVTYTVYNDAAHETRVYNGWTGSAATGPTGVSREYRPAPDSGGTLYYEALTTSATPSVSGSVPTGQEAITSADVQSLGRELTNDAGQTVESDAYPSLSGVTYSLATLRLGTFGHELLPHHLRLRQPRPQR